ncbi:putative lipid II flippase FtsW [Patescibacteria group bacterium]|nr:putative lipid II flippase FtsW [Patescibacteria group bacterium]MBU4458740.1 putative lipid II flippase FtsW [Patescibacteria group bacterium]MCG2696041.1 putative lipid II flippase FtsW [Candidatus Portnoybacteria bacterium]
MKTRRPDKGLVITIFLLLIFGLAMLFNASIVISQEQTGKPYYYFFHQLIYGVGVGLIAFFICQKINYRIWKKFSLLIFFAALVLSALVFVPQLSYGHGGAHRWIAVGQITFQPSEFLKLALIIYLAAFLSKRGNQPTLIPFLAIAAVIVGLMTLQKDLGTLVLIIIVGSIMYFLGGARIRDLAIMVICYAITLFSLIKFFPHRIQRFITFLNPSIDPQGISYQINQALLAIGSGGLFGRGLGHSIQKYSYLPEPMGDSVFAIIAEEIGFVGSIGFIFLIIFLIFKGFRISKNLPDDFGKLLAIGIVCWFGFQALINIGAISGLIPLTGIPLPFVSYGGSALIITLAGAGILTNISKYQN